MNAVYSIAGVQVSRPDKVLFEGDGKEITKADVAQYYADVAEVMLPHLRGRPITMQRFPDGIASQGFYEKKVPEHFPGFVATTTVATADGSQEQVVVDSAATLVYLADQACLTPHTWLSTAKDLRRPDQLIIDLDPSVPGTRAVRRATVMVGDLLEELGLPGYLKTTGSRGYHVVVPLRREADFDEVHRFARRLAEVLVARDEDLLTIEARKDKRGDRVLVDIARNAYAQTAAPPYALRALPHAPVATPITWDELSRTEPDRYTIDSVRRRLAQRPDPWQGMARHRRGLTSAARALAALGR